MKITYSKNIAWQEFFGTVYIFNEISHEAFILNDLAKEFWLLISKSNDFDEICYMLSKNFSTISFEQVKSDFNEFMVDLIHNDLLHTVEDEL